MRFWFIIAFVLIGFSGFSTHNRSGYISYCYNTQTGRYDFRIFTYTNLSSTAADRCEQTLYICDIYGNLQDSLVCHRNNSSAPCPSTSSGSGTDGVAIVPATASYGGVKANIYVGSKQLNQGYWILTMIDPNRDAGINNIPNSSSVAFALIDTMYAYSGIAGVSYNCTPTITNPPIQNACANSPWCYNPGANDEDNDSLDFSIIRSFQDDPNNKPQGVTPIGNETFPSGLTINRKTGTLCWNSPTTTGEYNIALLIKEYRLNFLDGKRYLVGETVFDIQILVQPCPPNNINFQNPPHDTCVLAGTTFTTNINVTSSGTTPPLTLTGTGLPFNSSAVGANVATLSSMSSGNSVSGTFSWSPTCVAVQANPYQITLQAADNSSPLANANFATFNVRVVGPPPLNLTATNTGDTISLHWNPPAGCIGNAIVKYLIYRIDGCVPFVPSPCQTGVPTGSGYTLVGITSSGITTYADSNFGQGFPPGNTYSYIVVAEFSDGAFSLASSTACVTLKMNTPIMMKASVDTTDALGRVNVWWNKPLASSVNFDTTLFPGPYKYILQRKQASNGTYTSIYTVTANNYAQLGQINNAIDTTSDVGIDTRYNSTSPVDQYYYKVAFYNTDVTTHQFKYIGTSSQASTIFLHAVPHDKKVILNWSVAVPWKNIVYYILQQRSGGATMGYDTVAITTSTRDTIRGLTNGQNYCFKILSKGEYGNPVIQKYIWNFSEKVCATPIDDEPPCQPSLAVTGNCSSSSNKLVWTNPNHTCNISDVVKYVIYYTPFQDSTLNPIDSLMNPLDTSYTTDFSSSIAGCYVVVAVDSVGNRSPLNNEMCTDNCPEYELPNIFTPNGDNINDQYIPVKNKFIKDVEFTMYNRWGEIVFETSDPALKWDGKSSQMKQPVSDGTYFYICKVHELHYYGIKDRTLKGFVQVLH
jgi:gliding motility-associated-like protein